MRFTAVFTLMGAMLMWSAAPAHAQWHGYVSRDLGFSFHAPGEIMAERGNYNAFRSGEHPTIVYRSVVDDIEYKIVVIDFRDRAEEGANLLVEAAFTFREDQDVLMGEYIRIDDAFGLRTTINLPDNGGRSMGSFHFNDGYLYQVFATVFPANGDYASPFVGRFVDSFALGAAEVNEGVIELSLPD